MLTLAGLTAFERSLRGTRVLSVYLSTRTTDPSRRKAWRPAFQAALKVWSTTLEAASRDERADFASARDAIERALGESARAETEGIACFASVGGVLRLEPLPFPVDATVVWGLGPAIAPMVRALKEERPVLVAVVDGKRASLYRYRFEALSLADSVSVDPRSVDPSHAPARINQRFHQGVRGTSGQDEAQHEWAAATDRLARDVAHRIAQRAEGEVWILVGGRPNVAQRVLALLPPTLQRRAERVDITNRTTLTALTQVARAGASRMRNATDAAALDQLADGAGVAAAAVGDIAAQHALRLARVQDLFLTSRYVKDHAADAEAAVRAALEQGARVETVSGEASTKLDAMGGIAARLRYAMRPVGATAAGHPVA